MDDLCYVLYGNHPLFAVPILFRIAAKIRVIQSSIYAWYYAWYFIQLFTVFLIKC